MNGDTLRMRLRPSQRGPMVIAVGRLSISNVEFLLRVVAAALRIRGVTTLTLHLSQVVYIDVAGVAGLLACQRQTLMLGRTFVVAAVSRQVLAGIRCCAADGLLRSHHTAGQRCGIGRDSPPPPRYLRPRLFCSHVSRGGGHGSAGPAMPHRP